MLRSESGADWLEEHLDGLKVAKSIKSGGEADLGKVYGDQGDEERSDENNNTPTSDGAMEMRGVKEIDLPQYDPDQAADVSGTSDEKCHPVTTLQPINVESSNDSGKFNQTTNSSTSPMKKTPSSTIIDASDGEECDLDAGIQVEPTLAAELLSSNKIDL